MAATKLSKLETQIMEALWTRGEFSAREILDSLPAKGRPAYNTIQTMMYRMEPKGVVRRIKEVANFHIFAASISRDAAQRRLTDELLALFGGRSQSVMAHFGEPGKLSLNDVREVEKVPGQLKAIVAHEICHVGRHDNLTFAVHMIVEALFCFHPAVWWIGARSF